MKLIDADKLIEKLIELGFYPAIVKRAIEEAPAIESDCRWIPVTPTTMPMNEQRVIICAERTWIGNPNNPIRIIATAFHTDGKHNTDDSCYGWDPNDMDMEYDEKNDVFLIPEGWWESVEYTEQFAAVDDKVVYWMPLPEKPKEVKINANAD